MIHVRTPSHVATVALLSLLASLAFLAALFVWSPFALIPWLWALCSPRELFAAARRVIKPAALWWNAWQYKQAEEDIAYFASFKLRLDADACRQRVRQRKLQKRRERIAGW